MEQKDENRFDDGEEVCEGDGWKVRTRDRDRRRRWRSVR